MNEYIVKYWVKGGGVVAIRVQTDSASQAQSFAESMPNFNGLYSLEWK